MGSGTKLGEPIAFMARFKGCSRKTNNLSTTISAINPFLLRVKIIIYIMQIVATSWNCRSITEMPCCHMLKVLLPRISLYKPNEIRNLFSQVLTGQYTATHTDKYTKSDGITMKYQWNSTNTVINRILYCMLNANDSLLNVLQMNYQFNSIMHNKRKSKANAT